MKIARKISTKTLGFTMATLKEILDNLKDGESAMLYSVAGIARDTQQGESQYGPWLAFKGEFVAKLAGKDETIRSPKAFFPSPFDGMLENAISAAQEDGTKRPVEFGVQVFIKKDNSVQAGYTYVVQPVVKVKEADALNSLLETIETAEHKKLLEDTGKGKATKK